MSIDVSNLKPFKIKQKNKGKAGREWAVREEPSGKLIGYDSIPRISSWIGGGDPRRARSVKGSIYRAKKEKLPYRFCVEDQEGKKAVWYISWEKRK